MRDEGLVMAIVMLNNIQLTVSGEGGRVAGRAKNYLFRQVELGSKEWEWLVSNGVAC